MQYRLAWIATALSGFVMVMAGAFGAHGLQGQLNARMLEVFETAVRYQAWHTLAMLGVLVWCHVMPARGQALTLWLWGAGIALFSGSLYLLTLTGAHGLGMVTPLGGMLMMAGWLSLGVTAWRARA